MREGKKRTILFYQLISEAFLIFLFIYPFSSWFLLPFSLGSFLLIMAGAILCLLVAIKIRHPLFLFIPVPIVLASIGILSGMHWVLSIVISGLLIWRFVKKEMLTEQGQEQTILILSTIVAFVEVILFREESLIVLLLLQYVVIIGGYTLSHFLNIDTQSRQKGNGKNLLGVTAVFIVLSSLLILLISPVRALAGMIWNGVSYTFLFGVKGFLNLLTFMGVPINDIDSLEDTRTGPQIEFEMNEETLEEQQVKSDGSMVEEVVNATEWGVIILILTGVLVGLFLIYRARRANPSLDANHDTLVYQNTQAAYVDKEEGFFSQFQRSRPHGAIRKHFAQFETYAYKKGYGRKPQESIENWFNRIDLEVDRTSLYQKVRYGDESLTKNETEEFYKEIKHLKEQLEQKNKE